MDYLFNNQVLPTADRTNDMYVGATGADAQLTYLPANCDQSYCEPTHYEIIYTMGGTDNPITTPNGQGVVLPISKVSCTIGSFSSAGCVTITVNTLSMKGTFKF